MYRYEQSTGKLTDANGTLVGTGIAGQGLGLNNPDMQEVHNVGPIPRGRYTITAPYTHPHLGPLTMNLLPFSDNEMFGRSDFRIHGFSYAHPELSSEGCITQQRSARQIVADNLDHNNVVEVVR